MFECIDYLDYEVFACITELEVVLGYVRLVNDFTWHFLLRLEASRELEGYLTLRMSFWCQFC
jgi:hypothetical protein